MGVIGNRILNPMDLFKHKSVWVHSWQRHSPTAFMVSLQLTTLKLFIDRGIYEYEPAEKSTKSFIEKIK